jgi:hypothetical protein
VPHTFWVRGDKPGRVLTCVWPGGYDGFMSRCAEEFATGAPEMHKLFHIGHDYGINFLTPVCADYHMSQHHTRCRLPVKVVQPGDGEAAQGNGNHALPFDGAGYRWRMYPRRMANATGLR